MDLPEARAKHCIVLVNATHALITSGYGGERPDAAWILDLAAEVFAEQQPMPAERMGAFCGAVRYDSVEATLVSAGRQRLLFPA